MASTTEVFPTRYCGFHHGEAGPLCPVSRHPSAQASTVELGDVLDTLREHHINPAIVTEHAVLLDDCGGCDDSDQARDTAVVRVAYTASNGARWHTDACPGCLDTVVRDLRATHRDVAAYLPVPAALLHRAVSA
jgi:hypothetical protein